MSADTLWVTSLSCRPSNYTTFDHLQIINAGPSFFNEPTAASGFMLSNLSGTAPNWKQTWVGRTLYNGQDVSMLVLDGDALNSSSYGLLFTLHVKTKGDDLLYGANIHWQAWNDGVRVYSGVSTYQSGYWATQAASSTSAFYNGAYVTGAVSEDPAVPEPGSLLLGAMGLGALMGSARRFKRAG